MNGAVAVIIVANGAVELMIPEDPIKRFYQSFPADASYDEPLI
jgi:hypothetical protein